MTIQSKRDACTGTCSGKLSTSHRTENDEMFAYVEITERLMTAQPKPPVIEPVGYVDKNLKLPMRKSLFAHVPPYIIFQNNRTTTTLPEEIAKHLLWWHTGGKFSSAAIRSTVLKSGFTMTTKLSTDWCGGWCSMMPFSRLRNLKNFRKINFFPGYNELSNKILLWKNFRRMRRKYGRKDFSFMPLSFVLPDQRSSLKKFMEMHHGIWIVKPPTLCGGRGIKIVSHWHEVPDSCSLISQQYISKPRLIDGVKFDIRLYVLLTSINPLRIYVYNEGLVRLATIKYFNHISTYSNKFMHLTNTSVNKLNPNFTSNDDPYKSEGNIWSLNSLWEHLNSTEAVDTLRIWKEIKDIAVKTIISAESSFFDAWKRSCTTSTYNFYQLFGFDILLDEAYRPWLLEVNAFPSMHCDTTLCGIVKGQLAIDYLSMVGFHVPDVLTAKELRTLEKAYGENTLCYNQQLYSLLLTPKERKKQYTFSKKLDRKDYLKAILNSLTPDDVRVLIRHEDEVAQAGQFERIFPTCETYVYFRFFNETRYYNLLLDAWENGYGIDRRKGVERLRELCKKKYHLS